jgi:threonine dehydrogenase-like Zn-dependent dehydrogenase
VEPGRFEVVEVDPPAPAEGQVLLSSYRSSICGSDLHLVYKGMYRGEHPAPPGWPGHEGVGTVLESPSGEFKPGDRVLAAPPPRFGRCFAQRHVVPAGSLVRLPDGSDPGLQVLGQQLGTVVFAMRRFWPAGLDREPGSVAIFGAGAAGLLFVQLARLAGFAKIIVSDLTESRLALAARFGATTTVHAPGQSLAEAVLDETSGTGADLVIEAVGLDSTRIACLDAVRVDGRVGYFGYPETLSAESTWSFGRAWAKHASIDVVTGAQGEPGLVSFREAVSLIASGTVDTAPLAADVYPLARIQDAFEAARQRRGPKISVEFAPGG